MDELDVMVPVNMPFTVLLIKGDTSTIKRLTNVKSVENLGL